MASSSPPPIPEELLDFTLLPDPIPLDFLDDLPPIGDEDGGDLSPETSDPSWVEEIERFLMGDDPEGPPPSSGDPFSLSDLVLPEDDAASKSGVSDGDASTSEEPHGGGLPEGRAEAEEGEGEGEDDAAAKKKRRQLRNRDSAMKSRERRKLYVQDLEKKSKFLEAECRRLQHLLQCCTAENIALQHRLQSDRLHGVSGARQESAVLFEESLLLGSLFWLVNIMFLFLVPFLVLCLDLGDTTIERARDRGLRQNQGANNVGKRSIPEFLPEVFLGRRRFKAFKRKMKFSSFPPAPVFLPVPCGG